TTQAKGTSMRKGRMSSCACALCGLGLAAACSSPVPSVPQGAVSVYLNLNPNSTAGSSCPPGTHWVNVPFTLSSAPQTTAVNKGNMAVDGVGEMGVSCSVKDAGGVFNVSGTLKSPAVDQAGNRLPTSTIVTFLTTI